MAQPQADRYRFCAPTKTTRPVLLSSNDSKPGGKDQKNTAKENSRTDGRGSNEFRPTCKEKLLFAINFRPANGGN